MKASLRSSKLQELRSKQKQKRELKKEIQKTRTQSSAELLALQNQVDSLNAASVPFDNTNNSTGTTFNNVQEALDYILQNI